MFRLRLKSFGEIVQSCRRGRTYSNMDRADKNEHVTSLYDFHQKNRGQLINFGGFLLPVSYADQTILASHLHTRQYASIFDVSHMLQTYIYGKDAISCIEQLCTGDIKRSDIGTANLTVFTNDYGGIMDDLIITKIDETRLFIVSNAAMRDRDKSLMQNAVSDYKSKMKDIHIEFLEPKDQSLIALQGPIAAEILKKCIPRSIDLNRFYFMSSISTNVAGIPDCRITRCGYTGEDGFEISLPSEYAERLVQTLLFAVENGRCRLAGLGSRDSLRLESGLCLYGSDIDEQTTPVEASLGWLIAKRRRSEMNFPGARRICEQLRRNDKIHKKRVGIISTMASPPARKATPIYYNTVQIGYVTSGCPSPVLQKNIAMGYVENNLSALGTQVQIKVRNKFYDAMITRMPFVKTNYFLRPKM